jgi:hypothetical protein
MFCMLIFHIYPSDHIIGSGYYNDNPSFFSNELPETCIIYVTLYVYIISYITIFREQAALDFMCIITN